MRHLARGQRSEVSGQKEKAENTQRSTPNAQRFNGRVSRVAKLYAVCLLLTFHFSLLTIFAPSARADRTFTPTITTVSTSGSVAAGAHTVTFIFSSDFAGTVLGATFAGSSDCSLTVQAPSGELLSAIAYTRSAGSIKILVVR